MPRVIGSLKLAFVVSLLLVDPPWNAHGGDTAGSDSDFVRIEQPADDVICAAGMLTVRGRCPPNRPVEVDVDGTKVNTVSNADGDWAIQAPLSGSVPMSETKLIAKQGSASAVRKVWVATIAPRSVQRVRFMWEPATRDRLKNIAQRTIVPTPSSGELETFCDLVPLRTETLFFSLLSPWNVEPAAQSGPDVFSMCMVDFEDGAKFGATPSGIDSGNQALNDWSEVYVPRISASIVGEFHLWKPMKRDEDLLTRAEDVAIVLSRTAVHEFGHAVGLVADQTPRGLWSWMRGCRGGHNCPMEHGARYGGGWEIMDPGDLAYTAPYVRLGESTPDRRSGSRRLAEFNRFNRSYLDLLHPHP